MNVRDVMRYESSALLGEWAVSAQILGFGVLPFAAVTDPEVIVRSPVFVRSVHPVLLENLSGRDRTATFVQSCPSLRYKFLWVHADNDNYRDDYKSYLRTVHKVTQEVPQSIAVDHLYNRARAKTLGTPWIRAVLAEGPINSSHGAGWEKQRTQSGLGRTGRDHTMDTMILLKLCGMPSPKKGQPLTAGMHAQIQQVAEKTGLTVNQIEEDIADLMKVAAFKPRA
jgi:hypothetical protein